jgi:hypothetical protein
MMSNYFPLVEEKTNQGLLKKGDWATMLDRILMSEEKPQRCGTQTFAGAENDNYVWPIENVKSLTERRQQVGLPPMEQYFKIAQDSFGIEMKWDQKLTVEKALELKN